MSEGNFYSAKEIEPMYGEIAAVYQAAFADDPWFEVSKCVDEEERCPGGLSPVQVGDKCISCGGCPSEQAYPDDELISSFAYLGREKSTSWYIEAQTDAGVTLAAVAWLATAEGIAAEKYANAPRMQEWLDEVIGGESVVWLDEVFADRALKPRGNLDNFGSMIVGLAEQLGESVVAFRTISKQMKRSAEKNFPETTEVFNRNIEVPDRRDFVVINLSKES